MSTVSDPKLAKLLADLNAAQAALTNHLIGATAHARRVDEGSVVPLKVAAAAWGISQDAALRRARRGHGVKRFGRWYVPSGLVDQPRKTGGRA